MTMTRNAALTVGAAVTAATLMVIFFQAPPLPVALGVVGAVTIILFARAWRG
jgi:hypothetical protein